MHRQKLPSFHCAEAPSLGVEILRLRFPLFIVLPRKVTVFRLQAGAPQRSQHFPRTFVETPAASNLYLSTHDFRRASLTAVTTSVNRASERRPNTDILLGKMKGSLATKVRQAPPDGSKRGGTAFPSSSPHHVNLRAQRPPSPPRWTEARDLGADRPWFPPRTQSCRRPKRKKQTGERKRA